VCGDRHKVRILSVVIQALEFEPVGPQNRWVDVMFITMGYIAMLDGGPVTWSSQKQPIIALSMAKAEYITLTTVGHKDHVLLTAPPQITLPVPTYPYTLVL
jgi:hypothetical protein